MTSYPSYRDAASNEAIAEKYDAVPYAAQSNALTHPDNLAAVAGLFGVDWMAVLAYLIADAEQSVPR